jgi:SAM-dependent methyltransferase
MLALLEKRIAVERLQNVTLILGELSNPRLPPDTLDLALMVDVYHELSAPQTVLAHIRTALKTDGRLVLLEYKGEDPTIPILPAHKMTVAQARMELASDGFVLTTVDSSLPRQHLLTFSKR